MEENKYKYLVDVCGLVELTDLTTSTGCSPDEPTKYSLVVKSKDRTAWDAFCDMFMRDDILFYMGPYSLQTFVLIDVDRYFNAKNHTFELTFRSTGYALHSEFVRRLKRINSLDDIDKSHSDESGERGEQGVVPVVLLNIIEELDLCTPLVIQPGGRAIAEVCCNKKLADFHRKYDSCRVIFRVDIGDDVRYYVVEHEGEVVIDSFMWILKEINYKEIPLMYCSGQLYKSPLQVERDGDNVSFSVPTLSEPRGTEPTMIVSNQEEKEMIKYYKELFAKRENVVTSQESLANTCAEIYRELGLPLKSTAEREMELIKKLKSGMLTYKREDVCVKFPQMRRARLNKPKSI